MTSESNMDLSYKEHATELRTIARRLQLLADEIDPTGQGWGGLTSEELGALARIEYTARRSRDRLLPPDLFGEPCWDILLDIYSRYRRNEHISVKQAILASCVPQTTALRHIQILVSRGLLDRKYAPHDARVVWLELTPAAITALEVWLTTGSARANKNAPS